MLFCIDGHGHPQTLSYKDSCTYFVWLQLGCPLARVTAAWQVQFCSGWKTRPWDIAVTLLCCYLFTQRCSVGRYSKRYLQIPSCRLEVDRNDPAFFQKVENADEIYGY